MSIKTMTAKVKELRELPRKLTVEGGSIKTESVFVYKGVREHG